MAGTKNSNWTRNLIYIGSDPGSDIALSASRGAGVAPRHLQLVCGQGDRQRYYVVNLGDAECCGRSGRRSHHRAPLGCGHCSRGSAAAWRVRPCLFDKGRRGQTGTCCRGRSGRSLTGSSAPSRATAHRRSRAAPSAVIGLQLFLPYTTLDPERPLDGTVILRNVGKQAGRAVQIGSGGVGDRLLRHRAWRRSCFQTPRRKSRCGSATHGAPARSRRAPHHHPRLGA